jgi:pyruvate ferredoxin oxidoreductase beta subunit
MISKREMKESFAPGHRACPGCGEAIATRWILKATGTNVIIVSPTGCLETFTSPYMFSPWRVPWIHPLFENGAAVASGVEAALRYKGRSNLRVVVIGGDGATFDIGLGALSGMFERGHPIPYICYDNEAYMNTGIQRCSSTPPFASTTTQPAGRLSWGKDRPKKNMPAIAMAHDVDYVATASVSYPKDLFNKVKKALTMKGPSYIQVHTPCCSGWGFAPERTIEIGRLAVTTGLAPLFEMERGELVGVHKIEKKVPVEEYLIVQRRFKHLFETDEGKRELVKIQQIADHNIERLGLLTRSRGLRKPHTKPRASVQSIP